ncbi:hypothetical protein BDP27DRAFT_1503286 [Rhodocollybia butyracea]|uniref:Senescence domain-containing protein n=1 Tax=Rhodocollybia butyracea TaxID=206335 RepID=A0A9P5PB60_9AGAR|nr:hypothetical protein BDP27DRAFT_1503286 [Rhodocollybia butyracea]
MSRSLLQLCKNQGLRKHIRSQTRYCPLCICGDERTYILNGQIQTLKSSNYTSTMLAHKNYKGERTIFLTDDAPQDLRGHLVLVNQDSVEIIGEIDKNISVHEDPALSKGQEDEPVATEISEDKEEWKAKAIEVFARKIPADLLDDKICEAGQVPFRPDVSIFLSFFIGSTYGKTLELVNGLISRIIEGRSSANTANPSASTLSLPPAYSKSLSPIPPMDQKPPLPPRSVSSTMLSQSSELEKLPLPSQARAITTPPPPPCSLKKDLSKLILSADLILSTLDESAEQLLDVGGRNATRMVNHRYGSEAAQSTALMAGSVKNVGLVYIDLRVGKKAIIRKVGKQLVKNQLKR